MLHHLVVAVISIERREQVILRVGKSKDLHLNSFGLVDRVEEEENCGIGCTRDRWHRQAVQSPFLPQLVAEMQEIRSRITRVGLAYFTSFPSIKIPQQPHQLRRTNQHPT